MRTSQIANAFQNFYNYEMQISQAKSFFGFCLLVLALNACSGNETANVNRSVPNANQTTNPNAEIIAQDDVEELGKIIKLPFAPVEATYIETNLNDKNSDSRMAAPDKKKLVAVLKFSAGDANQIVAQAEKYAPSAPLDVDAENWFPPELIAKSQETGDEFLKGISFAANDFLQSPYLNGRLTRINDTDYFVLELSSF